VVTDVVGARSSGVVVVTRVVVTDVVGARSSGVVVVTRERSWRGSSDSTLAASAKRMLLGHVVRCKSR
jgi:hypothetical protein